ncbi:hypothetical protein CVT26_013050 [Gymnopilus dilepis]|uniref:Uncharacterized protein n=1 Tax=Gymnopilus dilepis TaxID=231916 RepID=A0A409Y4H2_9AGAR|nr:hypothetical protein CVT26_013050 [Gymnopilus dilepis]
MDEFYDSQAAADLLSQFAESRAQLKPERQLSRLAINDIHIAMTSETRSWRLGEYDADTGAMEEFSLRVQGIVSAQSLPPITKSTYADPLKFRPYMRQSITITGLGTEAFQTGYENAMKIFLAFSDSFPEGTLSGWDSTTFRTYPCIEFNARYFSRTTAGVDKTLSIPFRTEVDPDGVLEKMVDDNFIHGTDNHVEYKWRIVTSEGAIQ